MIHVPFLYIFDSIKCSLPLAELRDVLFSLHMVFIACLVYSSVTNFFLKELNIIISLPAIQNEVVESALEHLRTYSLE